ncbi:MAG TPA: hypothetical protein VI078_13025 [bacterium]
MFRSRLAGVLVALLAAGGCGEAKIGIPAGFPADVPLPERAALRSARDLGKRGLNVVFETGEAVRPLSDRLGGRLRAAGWSPMSEAVLEASVFSSWRKGERTVALGVSAAAGVTVVGISVVERPYSEWEEKG